MNFSKQPISATIGQQIINSNYKNILDLNKAEIISLFKYYGVLLFRGFTTDTVSYTHLSCEF